MNSLCVTCMGASLSSRLSSCTVNFCLSTSPSMMGCSFSFSSLLSFSGMLSSWGMSFSTVSLSTRTKRVFSIFCSSRLMKWLSSGLSMSSTS